MPGSPGAALIADGYHARVDGLTSLAVLVGVFGVWLGYPLADPIIGLLITLAIMQIVWQSGKSVFTRALDGVEPGVIDAIHHAAGHIQGIVQISRVRARWLGHRLHAEISIEMEPHLTVAEVSSVTQAVRRAARSGPTSRRIRA